ncbi:hypothetical protein GKZ90_0016640 [Flavobacterium sp. MC2016-06]|jgi:hypothetical protein|uniref:hypothetical protein n=1 Tax=Flavobacterium sp. MC2016-06 TaxID=2676308 RepID=UPI0012BADC6D|nr:hypothetical protein [Flavobacterium sp. MC2016-06]MBU3860000.1 hypothetical protein [Flavobacterium sp. MC2016-06]
MKRIITLLLLLAATSVFSQSTDLDPYSFNLSYVTLPPKPVLDRANRTYKITVNAYRAEEAKAAQEYINENSGIDGFKKVSSNGYLEIVFNLENSMANLQEVRKDILVTKDSKGNEKRETVYVNVFKCRDFGSYSVVCTADPSLNKKYSLARDYTVENSFPTQGQANSMGIMSPASLKNSYWSNIISNMESRLIPDYGYIVEQTTDYVWILDSKKHPENENSLKALANIRAVFNKMHYDEDIEPLKVELQPTIKYFEGLDKKYTEDEKGHRKLRYEAYYALAVIYHNLDMPDESDIWCDKLIANKYDDLDGKGIKFRNESLKELLTVNQVKSRHMDVELRSNGIEDAVVDVANMDPNYFLKNDPKYGLVSLILTSNDTISGYAKWKDIDNLDKKISVSIPDENGNHNHIFKTYFADQVSKLIIKENDFYSTVSFKEGTKAAKGKPAFRFVREILNGKTVSMYQSLSGEIILKKRIDALGYSTSSVGWQMNTRTKFIELASACPVLAARANKNEFNTSYESLWTFVQALDVCK